MSKTQQGAVPLSVVATAAGVSIPTVSKVLNSRPDVAEATRAHVAAVLTQHGYTVRPASSKRTGRIDIRIVSLESTWSEAVVRGAAESAQRHSYDLVLTVDPDPDDCRAWVRHALQRGTDGAVSVVTVPGAEDRATLASTSTPIVVVDPRTRPAPDLLSVGATNWQGSLDATAHLVALGHRRIATITGTPEQENALARLSGYQTALIQAGLTVDENLVRSSVFGVSAGYECTWHLISLEDRPTAIFASCDDTALGALRALREAGLRVPEDMSLVGFDDMPIAAWLDPALTTVRQPLVEMGATAVDLIHRARTGSGHTLRTELATELIVRSSTAVPPRVIGPPNRRPGT
jgi:LacI family transcriptional regulator